MIDASSIAADLAVAERERKAIAPFTDAHPDLDLDTAYAAQREVVRAKVDAGQRIVGAKLGLTSRAKQQAMGVDAPLYGWVTSGMLAPFGEPVDVDRLIHPRVEPEIAFLLGPVSLPPSDLVDLRLLGCVLRLAGEVVATAAGAAVMGHPAASVAWLANRLGERGDGLRAGWLVFSGGLTAPVPLVAGRAVTAEFDGLGTVEAYAL